MAITDKDYMAACANGDGTYSGTKAVQWLMEAMTGKPMSDEDARALVAEAQERAKAKKGGA